MSNMKYQLAERFPFLDDQKKRWKPGNSKMIVPGPLAHALRNRIGFLVKVVEREPVERTIMVKYPNEQVERQADATYYRIVDIYYELFSCHMDMQDLVQHSRHRVKVKPAREWLKLWAWDVTIKERYQD